MKYKSRARRKAMFIYKHLQENIESVTWHEERENPSENWINHYFERAKRNIEELCELMEDPDEYFIKRDLAKDQWEKKYLTKN